MIALSDAVEFRLKDLLPELQLDLLASLFIQLRSGWLVLRELPPIVRDLFGKGLYDPMELIALEALLERKYSEPLPKKNAQRATSPAFHHPLQPDRPVKMQPSPITTDRSKFRFDPTRPGRCITGYQKSTILRVDFTHDSTLIPTNPLALQVLHLRSRAAQSPDWLR